MPFPPYSKLDAAQIIRHVYDEANDVLRTSATFSGTLGISAAAGDNIALADATGTNFVIVNPDGSLDVNVVNPLTISISSTSDSIAIGNQAGTHFLAPNADGSLNVDLQGLNAFKTSQTSVGTTAVQLAASSLSNRSAISIKVTCTPTSIVYIGNSNAVTTSTGYALFNGDSIDMDLTPTGNIWAISNNPGQTAYVLEIGS